jgi:hypothetical protein
MVCEWRYTYDVLSSLSISIAPNNGQVPVHGIWTYGNYCGAGGMGTPINGTDAACAAHDACYAQGGFTLQGRTSKALTLNCKLAINSSATQ